MAARRDHSMAAYSAASKVERKGEQHAATWAERTAANLALWEAEQSAVGCDD